MDSSGCVVSALLVSSCVVPSLCGPGAVCSGRLGTGRGFSLVAAGCLFIPDRSAMMPGRTCLSNIDKSAVPRVSLVDDPDNIVNISS